MESHQEMRVLFVSEYFPPIGQGGGEESCYLLAKYLSKKGIKITVLTSSKAGLAAEERKDGFTILRRLRTGRTPGSLVGNLTRAMRFPRSVKKEVSRLIRGDPFDLIHYFGTSSILGFVGRRTEIPQIAQVNSPVFFSPSGILTYKDGEMLTEKVTFSRYLDHLLKADEVGKMENSILFRLNPLFWCWSYRLFRRRLKKLRMADHCIAPSPFIRQLLVKEGFPQEKTTVIGNIVEKESDAKVKPKESKKGLLRILYLGSLVRYKGVMEMLQALEDLPLPYVCNCYGSGYLEKEMLELIAKNRLNVTIHRPVPPSRLGEVYRTHDLVVMPSLVTESFGRIAPEAMSHGVPVIASDVGGLHFLVEHRQDGILVPPGDVEALRNAILSIGGLRLKLVRNGLKTARRYEGGHIAALLEQLYRRILSTATRQSP